MNPTVTNPFRLPAIQHDGLSALRNALHETVEPSTARLPGLEELIGRRGCRGQDRRRISAAGGTPLVVAEKVGHAPARALGVIAQMLLAAVRRGTPRLTPPPPPLACRSALCVPEYSFRGRWSALQHAKRTPARTAAAPEES